MPRWEWDEASLSDVEKSLLEKLRAGQWNDDCEVILGDGGVPEMRDQKRKVRAALVRDLALGRVRNVELPNAGFRLRGAWIAGALSFEGASIERDFGLISCWLDRIPVFRRARLQSLFLNRSALPGLIADGLETRGDLLLRSALAVAEVRLLGARIGGSLDASGATLAVGGCVALNGDQIESCSGVFLNNAKLVGEVRLAGGRIGGDLSCCGAKFEGGQGVRLNVDRLEVRGDLSLRDATVLGEARLISTRIAGDFIASGAHFEHPANSALAMDGIRVSGSVVLRDSSVEGETRLPGAKVTRSLALDGATFDNAQGVALGIDGAEILGTLFLRRGRTNKRAKVRGTLSLAAARFGAICDAEDCWPQRKGDLILNRCQYNAFIGLAPVTSETRLRWLALQNPMTVGSDFWPQPYEHCAKVLREMGHTSDARAVLIEKERLQRADRRQRMRPARRTVHWVFDNLMGATTLYGHQPLLAFAWLLGFWLLGFGLFNDADRFDALKPNNAVVLRADEWTECAASGPRRPGHDSQRECFEAQSAGGSYPRFNALIYSADTLLPVVDLEMQGFWIPDGEAPWLHAKTTRIYLWLHIALGWALSLLAVAGFSGLVKSD